MHNELVFGVGCFSFEWSSSTGNRKGTDWRNSVTSRLAELPNISHINAQISEEFLYSTAPSTDSNQIDDFHPAPLSARIEFDIKIPRRQQEETPPGMKSAENFRVIINHEYWGPVAIVIPLEECSLEMASSNVRIVREHLGTYFKADEVLRFRTMGPSPFHADFSLKQSSTSENPNIDCEIIRSRGYDLFNFTYSPPYFNSLEDAFFKLQTEIVPDLSLFYSLVRRRNSRMKSALEIGRMTEELIAHHTKKGFRARWTRLFGTAKLARELSLAVMQAEYDIASDKEDANEDLNSLDHDRPRYFDKFLTEEADTNYTALVTNGRNVVSQLEKVRTKDLEITMLGGASIAGALAGGLISSLISSAG